MGEEEKEAVAAAEAAEAAEGKKTLFTKKNLLILLVLVVVLLVVTVFIVFKVIAPMVEGDATQDIEVESIGKKEVGIIYTMKENFIVNVAGTGATRFLRVAVAFEVEDSATESEMTNRDTEMRDLIILLLGTKKMEQLDSLPARDELKRELLNRVNDKLKSGNVMNIYFTDFVIQ